VSSYAVCGRQARGSIILHLGHTFNLHAPLEPDSRTTVPPSPADTLSAYIVEPEFEPALDAELGASSIRTPRWPGVLTRPSSSSAKPDPMFARQSLPAATVVKVSDSAELPAKIAQEVLRQLASSKNKDIAGLFVYTPHDGPFKSCTPLLAPTRTAVKQSTSDAHYRLLPPDPKAILRAWGREAPCVQVAIVGRTSALVSAGIVPALNAGGFAVAPWAAGLPSITTDKQAPSRAYRKLEETFQWLGRAPRQDETVVDLGGAPGGWAHTALKRGAFVTAVDRSPLAPPAAGHPRLNQIQGDAFAFVPPAPVDWLLCDVICEPPRSIDLIDRWAANGWCRNLVVTVKFKGPVGNHVVVEPIVARLSALGFAFARAKHMHNNHNEIEVFAYKS